VRVMGYHPANMVPPGAGTAPVIVPQTVVPTAGTAPVIVPQTVVPYGQVQVHSAVENDPAFAVSTIRPSMWLIYYARSPKDGVFLGQISAVGVVL